jgi:hypothetical protein
MSETIQDRPTPHDASALILDRVLAKRWNKSVRTLQRWRSNGYGPAYLRIGGTVYYRLADVLAFEAAVRRGGETSR